MTTARLLLAATLALALVARAGLAQRVPGAELTQVLVGRLALEDLATQLEATAASRSASSDQRARARSQAAAVRRRLTEGDFQVGDRIMLQVEGETALTDTFTVELGQQLTLPSLGSVSLAGTLRVELNDRLTPFIAQFVRNPRVRAHALIRVAVFGAVGKQGYFTVPVDILVTDVLEYAGGFTTASLADKITIERGGEVLYSGDVLQQAIVEGRTLDALSIRAGDRLMVPEKSSQQDPTQRFRTIQYLLQIPLSLYALYSLLGGN